MMEGGEESIFIQNEVIDLLTEYATNERISRLVGKDEELRAARIHAEEKYKDMKSALTDEQGKMLDSFITADSGMDARMEFLSYQQGLKDMFNLIMSLMDAHGFSDGASPERE